MNPDVQIISIGPSEIQMTKQYYNKSAVLTNYTRTVADMLHVVSTGKSILNDSIPLAKNASLYEKAQRIVDFEKLVSTKVVDPEVQNDIQVSADIAADITKFETYIVH